MFGSPVARLKKDCNSTRLQPKKTGKFSDRCGLQPQSGPRSVTFSILERLGQDRSFCNFWLAKKNYCDEESEDVQPKNKPWKQRQVENLESEVEEVQDDVEPPEEEIQEVDDRVDGSLDEHEVSTVQMTKKPKLIKSFIIL